MGVKLNVLVKLVKAAQSPWPLCSSPLCPPYYGNLGTALGWGTTAMSHLGGQDAQPRDVIDPSALCHAVIAAAGHCVLASVSYKNPHRSLCCQRRQRLLSPKKQPSPLGDSGCRQREGTPVPQGPEGEAEEWRTRYKLFWNLQFCRQLRYVPINHHKAKIITGNSRDLGEKSVGAGGSAG